MPTYIITARLTQKSIQGFIDKPEDREAAIAAVFKAAGATLKAAYVTTGPSDLLFIVEAPASDNLAAAGLVFGAANTGTDMCTVKAWSFAEFKGVMEKAAEITGSYRKPGI